MNLGGPEGLWETLGKACKRNLGGSGGFGKIWESLISFRGSWLTFILTFWKSLKI